MKPILFLLAFFIVIALLAKFLPGKKKQDYDLSKYYLKSSIVTPVEKWAYQIISRTLSDQYILAPKVGMKDFIGINVKNDYMKYFSHIAQKHIDFLICDKETLSPVLGIELDDNSHNKDSRKNRDQNVDQIYNAVGLKIFHIPTKIKEEALVIAINNEVNCHKSQEIDHRF